MIGIFLILTLMICGALFFNRNKVINYTLIIIYLLSLSGFTVWEYWHINSVEWSYFSADALGILLLGTLALISIPTMYHSYCYFVKNGMDIPRQRAIYFSSMIALLTAMVAAYLSNHIAVTWIFVEITTLTASVLIYHRRNSRSLEGTWKYVFVCAISISLVFIGILFLSFAIQQTGSTDLSFRSLYERAALLNPFWLKLAFIFIFTGYTAKLGLVPMYTAGIDAKDKAPSPAGAVFSSLLMNVGFVGIFRMYVVMANTSLHTWTNHVIMVAAILSVFVAAVYMFKVKNIKRMLAYSSVEHMGIVMIGLAAGGVGYYAAVLHLIFHSLVKSSMFFQMGQIYRVYKSKSIYDTGNYFKYNLTGAIVILICYINAIAMPPSGMFISEFLVFRSLFDARNFLAMIIVMILLTMIIWAFGKNIFNLMFTQPIDFDDSDVEKINPAESLSQFILLGLVIYLGINPPAQFISLIQEAVQSLPH